MARPLKQINWDIIEKRMEAGCTAKEIASSANIDINTFYDRFKLEYGKCFADCADDFYSLGNANLKLTQYVKAIGGNIPMLLLLGRERLGQSKNDDSSKNNQQISPELITILSELIKNPDIILKAKEISEEAN